MTKPIVAVLGITGKQGGSVAKAILSDGKYTIRGVTRDLSKPHAKHLLSQGIEVIQGDATKEETLTKLFHGVKIVFAVTSYFDPGTSVQEEAIGKLTADVAKKAGVEFYVWSTLPNANKISNKKFSVPHFDMKANVDDYLKTIGLKCAFVALDCYMENFESYFAPKKMEDGTYVIGFPFPLDKPMGLIDIADDFGKAVLTMINHQDEWAGKWVPLFGDYLSIQDCANLIGEANGVIVNSVEIPRYSFGPEFGQMFDFFLEFGYGRNSQDEALLHKLLPNPTKFSEWTKLKLIKL